MMGLTQLREIVGKIKFNDWYIGVYLGSVPQVYLQITCPNGTNNVTGEPYDWKGRKWLLSYHMTEGEIVQTAWAAVQMAMVHEMREQFTYEGIALFDGHYDIRKLMALRAQPDALKGGE